MRDIGGTSSMGSVKLQVILVVESGNANFNTRLKNDQEQRNRNHSIQLPNGTQMVGIFFNTTYTL